VRLKFSIFPDLDPAPIPTVKHPAPVLLEVPADSKEKKNPREEPIGETLHKEAS